MRHFLFILLLFTIAKWSHSQNVCAFSSSEYNMYLCVEGYAPSYPSLKMTNTINEILKTAGLSNSNFVVKSCSDVDNALAFIHNNERYILMDEAFFNSFTKENLMYVMILAHEIGHHLHGHVSLNAYSENDLRNDELQADEFVGFIIGKLGFELIELQSIARKILPKEQSSSHPGVDARLKSYLKGYNAAIKEDERTVNKYYGEIKEQAINSILNSSLLKARDNYVELIDDFSPSKLDETIDSYLALKFLSDDLPWIEGELAELYAYKRDYANANILALNSYNKLSKHADANGFLVLAWEYSRRGGFKMDAAYLSKLEKLDYSSLANPTILKYFARFIVNIGKLEEAREVLDKAVNEFGANSVDDAEILLSDILNDRAVINLRLENYANAEADLQKSIDIRRGLEINGSLNDNMNFLIDISNSETIESNYLLALLRNERYSECIELSEEFINTYPESGFIKNGDVEYYIGRSLFELKRYNESLEYLNNALSKTKDNGFLYLYRGLVHHKIGKSMKACIDLTIACDQNLPIACNRLKLLCDE